MMATYYHGNSEIQETGDGLQPLILMNPDYGGYSATHVSNFAGTTVNHSHAPPSHSHIQDDSKLHTFPNIHYNFYNPPIDIRGAREVTPGQQGLSLSLSSQSQSLLTTAADVRVRAESPPSASGIPTVVLNSKYLKAAQELLDEVVNTGYNGQPKTAGGTFRTAAGGGHGVAKVGADLTAGEKQDIQMKKATLISMLDEIEQRYKQYHHQIQLIISLFEQVAGAGPAKTYTSLASQTISKQFRCLKDAILAQIRVANISLGEDGGKIEGSRLKYINDQVRQRALQQLGMIQHNAWRPQRGLPERAVSVLRAWLFEHFLHPYPKDSDKIMLAKQTGLTRSQVSNWFINARVRLWKPMVEEMYMEEMKQHEANGSDDHKTTKTKQNEVPTSKSTNTKQDDPIYQNIAPGFNSIGSSEMEAITQSMNMEQKQKTEGFTLTGAPTNFTGGFGSFPMLEFERFEPDQFQDSYSSNGVLLTLGLPHCENIPISGAQEAFLPNQSIGKDVEIVEANDFSVYEDTSIQNRRNFAAQFVT